MPKVEKLVPVGAAESILDIARKYATDEEKDVFSKKGEEGWQAVKRLERERKHKDWERRLVNPDLPDPQ